MTEKEYISHLSDLYRTILDLIIECDQLKLNGIIPDSYDDHHPFRVKVAEAKKMMGLPLEGFIMRTDDKE